MQQKNVVRQKLFEDIIIENIFQILKKILNVQIHEIKAQET